MCAREDAGDVCQSSDRDWPIPTMEALRVVVELEELPRRHIVQCLAVSSAPVNKHGNREGRLRERNWEAREVKEEVRVGLTRLGYAVRSVLCSRYEVDGAVSDAVACSKELRRSRLSSQSRAQLTRSRSPAGTGPR